MPGTSSSRSTAMMSAPSWASRMAWLRPCPRPAPLMKATLPATRPGIVSLPSLLVREAGVDGERHPGDVAAVVGDEEQDRVGDVDRLHQVNRQRVHHRLAHRRVLLQELLHDVVDDHGRVHTGRVHRVYADAVLGEDVGVRAHEADHAVLGRGVTEPARGLAADAVDSCRRTGEHDRAARAPLDHARYGGLDRVVDPGEVDVEDVLPLLRLRVHGHRGDAGVGEEHVDRAEFGRARLEGLLRRGGGAEVGAGGEDPPVQGLDLLDRLGEVLWGGHRVSDGGDLLANVDRDDVGALLGEPDRVAAALAARRTGDESDLAFKLSHDLALLSFARPVVLVGRARGFAPGGFAWSRDGEGAGSRGVRLAVRCAFQLALRGRSDIARAITSASDVIHLILMTDTDRSKPT